MTNNIPTLNRPDLKQDRASVAIKEAVTAEFRSGLTREAINKAVQAYNDQSMQLADAQYVCIDAAIAASGLPVEVERLTEENSHLRDEYAAEIGRTRVELTRLRRELSAKQAKIDALMLEYCPDEMTPEQLNEWANNQRRVSPEEEAAIDAALSKEDQT